MSLCKRGKEKNFKCALKDTTGTYGSAVAMAAKTKAICN
jgi:hypothetical protein